MEKLDELSEFKDGVIGAFQDWADCPVPMRSIEVDFLADMVMVRMIGYKHERKYFLNDIVTKDEIFRAVEPDAIGRMLVDQMKTRFMEGPD